MQPERQPNPDRSVDVLAARLRALPPPPIPADLEARLLANIPAEMQIARRPWRLWIGVAGALAAACLLAVLTWLGRDDKNPVSYPPPNEPSANGGVPLPTPPIAQDASVSISALLNAQRNFDEAAPSTFAWPLPETSPIRIANSIPPDLLD